jgi:hypothetical protein
MYGKGIVEKCDGETKSATECETFDDFLIWELKIIRTSLVILNFLECMISGETSHFPMKKGIVYTFYGCTHVVYRWDWVLVKLNSHPIGVRTIFPFFDKVLKSFKHYTQLLDN